VNGNGVTPPRTPPPPGVTPPRTPPLVVRTPPPPGTPKKTASRNSSPHTAALLAEGCSEGRGDCVSVAVVNDSSGVRSSSVSPRRHTVTTIITSGSSSRRAASYSPNAGCALHRAVSSSPSPNVPGSAVHRTTSASPHFIMADSEVYRTASESPPVRFPLTSTTTQHSERMMLRLSPSSVTEYVSCLSCSLLVLLLTPT